MSLFLGGAGEAEEEADWESRRRLEKKLGAAGGLVVVELEEWEDLDLEDLEDFEDWEESRSRVTSL